MAKFTQTNCNEIKTISWEVLEDGRNWVRGTNKDDQPFEFEDELSIQADTKETKRAAANAFLIANCEYETAPADLSTPPEAI